MFSAENIMATAEPDSQMQSRSPELNRPNFSVVLLGNSWSQRSSVGNFILGQTVFNTEEEPGRCLSVSGLTEEKEPFLMNIPDLLHPDISEDRLTEYVETCVRLSAPGPHVFLVVLHPEGFMKENDGDREDCEVFEDAVSDLPSGPGSLKPEGAVRVNLDHVRTLGIQLLAHARTGGGKSQITSAKQNKNIQFSSLRIVLLGKSEDKKTKLGNFIIGDQVFHSSVTKSVKHCVSSHGRWREKPVTVVKTPDMFSLSEETLRKEVERSMNLCPPGPNVLLLLVKPSEFHREDKEKLQFILSFFGQDAFKYSMIIITDKKKGTDSTVDQVIKKCGGRNYNLSESQHDQLMEKIENIVYGNKRTFLTFTEETRRNVKPTLNLVLCGWRGSVKTSAAKSILGLTELRSASNSSECVINQGEVCGRWVSLVELPALYGKPQETVMEESFWCVSLCDPEGVHAFILVLPVGPLTDEDKGELETIQNTFSSRVKDFTMILFTVDSDSTAAAAVNFLHGNKEIQELCQSCGGRSVVLNIKDNQEVSQVLGLLGLLRT
ncbi:hypothetical protein Q5P01_015378 [Channa striata]|uniref:AIG1-type G domain-containing protein n=1 Tax=Channa striata TaxID=64152 RepID=A0AA88MHW1_CHASR|nr:hypothetical protein Q5P01_015378 [Channa striata]